MFQQEIDEIFKDLSNFFILQIQKTSRYWATPIKTCMKGQNLPSKKNATMAFYNMQEQLHLQRVVLVFVLQEVFCNWGMECGSQGTKHPTM